MWCNFAAGKNLTKLNLARAHTQILNSVNWILKLIIAAGSVISVTYKQLWDYLNLKAKENRLNIEIEHLEQIIKNYKGGQPELKAVKYNALPGGSTISKPTENFAMENLKPYYALKRRKQRKESELNYVEEQISEIENYIEIIPDDELKEMFRHRFYLRESYNYIAKQYNLSRNSVSKKINEYLKFVQD